MQSSTLLRLLQLTWRSPVFGDAYPATILTKTGAITQQIEEVHQRFLTRLEPILKQGMPYASAAEVQEIMRQIGPKSTAFCSAIAAAEIHDVERLCAAAVSIALVYWADQSMDRGDEAMMAAVHSLNSQASNGNSDYSMNSYSYNGPSKFMDPAASVDEVYAARRRAVRQIEQEVIRLSRPEDMPVLLDCVFHETLQHEARMRELSQLYLRQAGSNFWDTYAEEIARLSIINGAFIYVTSAIYAIYRLHQPHLPPLVEIFNQPAMMVALRGAGNAAIRVFDDLGDRHIDQGHYPEWGEFCLNIFNQPHPRLLRAFLLRAGMDDAHLHESVLAAFQAGGRVSQTYIIEAFKELVRDQVMKLPPPIWQRYRTFLTLSKRVIEAGYVNTLGDKALAGTAPLGDSWPVYESQRFDDPLRFVESQPLTNLRFVHRDNSL